MGDIRIATVAELQRAGLILVEDGNHGEYRPRPDEFVSSGVAFIRAADLSDGRVLFENAARINERARERITKGIGRSGDVLLSHKGTVGKLALVPEDAPPFVCSPQTTFWRSLDENEIDQRYLYAFMRSPRFQAQLAARAGETDMAPYVSLTAQRTFLIVLPEITIQRRIAELIGMLDDKIELNRRVNETLEQTVRTIFRDWFVEFGPTRAKMAGATPYVAPHIWSQFPEQLGLRDAPAGWNPQALSHHVTVQRGISYSGSGLTSAANGVSLHNLNSILEGGGYKYDGLKWYSGAYRDRNVCAPGDLLIANTEQGFEHLLIGYAAIIPARFQGVNLFSHHLYKIEVRPGSPLTSEWLCFMMNEAPDGERIRRFSNGTTVNMLPADAFSIPEITVPPPVLIDKFSSIASGIRAKQEALRVESDTLVQVRDELLPRLFDGRVTVTSGSQD